MEFASQLQSTRVQKSNPCRMDTLPAHYFKNFDSSPARPLCVKAPKEPSYPVVNHIRIGETLYGLGFKWEGGYECAGVTQPIRAWFFYKNQRIDLSIRNVVERRLETDFAKQLHFQEWALKDKELFGVQLLGSTTYHLAKDEEKALTQAIKARVLKLGIPVSKVRAAVEAQCVSNESDVSSFVSCVGLSCK